jgi:hypothetical protein
MKKERIFDVIIHKNKSLTLRFSAGIKKIKNDKGFSPESF